MIKLTGIQKTYQSATPLHVLKGIDLHIEEGELVSIMGASGSGKSTLMKIIAGVEKSYQGEVVWAPGYSVGYLEQEPQMDPEKTVLEVVQEGVQEVMDLSLIHI